MKEPSKGARKAARAIASYVVTGGINTTDSKLQIAHIIEEETHLGELVEAMEELANAMDEKVNCPRCGRAFPGTQYIPPGRHSKLCPVSKGRKALALVRGEEGE